MARMPVLPCQLLFTKSMQGAIIRHCRLFYEEEVICLVLLTLHICIAQLSFLDFLNVLSMSVSSGV